MNSPLVYTFSASGLYSANLRGRRGKPSTCAPCPRRAVALVVATRCHMSPRCSVTCPRGTQSHVPAARCLSWKKKKKTPYTRVSRAQLCVGHSHWVAAGALPRGPSGYSHSGPEGSSSTGCAVTVANRSTGTLCNYFLAVEIYFLGCEQAARE